MDKGMVKRWFNGMYGKLPPEKQLEELAKLKECVNELSYKKLESFEKRQARCKCCACYSFKGKFKKSIKNRIVKGEDRLYFYEDQIYTCPKCNQDFVYNSKFVKFL